MKRTSVFLAISALLALSMLSCSIATKLPAQSPGPRPAVQSVATVAVVPSSVSVPPPLDLVSSQDTLIQLYQKTNPGVVSIRVLTQDGGGLGSGFVIDTAGDIITNYHVIENETDLEVAFASGFKARGEVLGTDLDSDLAIVKVTAPAEELHPLSMGNSDQVQVGQTVVAIGNPFGFKGTMTTGIVSGLGRTLSSLHTTADGQTFSAADIIQTDAAINPGNSGGPLLNLNGEVVGVNESIITTGGDRSNSGVGFAVPINIVKQVAPTLISSGKYDYPYLGISSLNDSQMTLLVQEALKLPRSTGVYILNVTPGGPAEKAGLQGGKQDSDIPGIQTGGDLVIAIDGQTVNGYNDLISYLIKNKKPGDSVVLTVLRADQQLDLTLVLDKRPK